MKKTKINKTDGTDGLPRVMTVSEAARWLRVSRRTVERALWSGEMGHYRIGVRIVIPESSLASYLEARKVGGLACA